MGFLARARVPCVSVELADELHDARLFNGEWDYPRLEDLVAQVRAQGHYDVEVSADIIRLTPLSAGHSPGTFAGG